MDLSAIYSKTPKGLRARASLIGGLSTHLMKVLAHVDGASRAENILQKFEKITEQELSVDLIKLEQEGYIRLATVTSEDNNWALTINFEPMQVEEYQSEEELEAATQQKNAQLAQDLAQHVLAEQAKQDEKRLAEEAKAEKKARKLREKEKIKAEAKVQAQLLLENEQLIRQQQEEAEKQCLAEAAAAAEAAELERQKAEAEAQLKAQEEAEKAQQKLAAEKQKEKLKNEALEQEKRAKEQAKEQARLEIASVLRKAEEDRKQAAQQAKADKLEAKRQAKAEQEAQLEAERLEKENAKEAAKELARLEKQAKLEMQATLEAEKQAKLDAETEEKAQSEAQLEANKQAQFEADQIAQALQTLSDEDAERLRLEQHAVDMAKAKQLEEEQAALTAKQNAKIEMERIAKVAEQVRVNTNAEQNSAHTNTKPTEAKQLDASNAISVHDFDAAEAAEEAAFAEEEEIAEAEQKIKRTIEKTSKKAAEDAGRADIKNAAIEQAQALASVKTKSFLLPVKKIKQLLRSVSKVAFVYVPLLLALLVGLAHFINLSTLIKPIEKLASDNIGRPVSIEKVHASIWPQPHLVLEQVSIGDSANIKAMHVVPVAASLFENTKLLKSIELDGLKLDQSNVDETISWVNNLNHAKTIKVAQIKLKNINIAISDLTLEPLNGQLNLSEFGAINSVDLANNQLSLNITPQDNASQGANYVVNLKANNWQLPFNPKLVFTSLSAKASTSQNQMTFSQIDGELVGGKLTGQADVKWPQANSQWQTAGDFKLENANAGALLTMFDSAILVDGKLALNGRFSSQANTANQLAAATALQASFHIHNGDIQGIELARAVLSRANQSLVGNDTRFDQLTGSVQVTKDQYQFANLQLKSPQINASGYFNVAADQAVSGRVSANLAAQSRRLQANFAVSGRGKNLKSN